MRQGGNYQAVTGHPIEENHDQHFSGHLPMLGLNEYMCATYSIQIFIWPAGMAQDMLQQHFHFPQS